MMISEALELRMEGGRVSHSWCMRVVRHVYGGLCGGQGWWWWTLSMQGKANWVGRMSGDAGAFPDCDVNTLITPDHIAVQMCSSW